LYKAIGISRKMIAIGTYLNGVALLIVLVGSIYFAIFYKVKQSYVVLLINACVYG